MRSLHERPGVIAVAVATLLALSTAPANTAPALDLLGPACDTYAAGGPAAAGSLAGAAQQPLTVAIAGNPRLSALSAALSGNLNPAVNVVDTPTAASSPSSRRPIRPSPVCLLRQPPRCESTPSG